MLLFYNSFLFAAFYDVTASIPSQFAEIYHYNALQIGLCYIPFGFGSMCAALTNGHLLDRNYARWCKRLGIKITKGRNQDLRHFPIEKVRLQIAIPASYSAAALTCVFGWIMDVNGPLAAILVVLFFTSFSMSVAFNVTSTLLVDFYPNAPATATAANNLVRCLLGAGATGVVVPMLNKMGRGWTFTFLTLVLIATSPMLWAVYFWGHGWREQRWVREQRKKDKQREKNDLEKGAIKNSVGEREKQSLQEPVPAQGGQEEGKAKETLQDKDEVSEGEQSTIRLGKKGGDGREMK